MALLTHQVTSGSEIAALTRPARSSAFVKDVLLTAWSENAELLSTRLREAATDENYNAAKSWAIAAGIATEKTLLLDGQPTQLVGHLHEHRHDMADLLQRLGSVARRIGTVDAIATVMPTMQPASHGTDNAIATVVPEGEGGNGQPGRVGHGRGSPTQTPRKNKS